MLWALLNALILIGHSSLRSAAPIRAVDTLAGFLATPTRKTFTHEIMQSAHREEDDVQPQMLHIRKVYHVMVWQYKA